VKEQTKKNSRITTLDLMRGYFLVGIVLTHINFFPNGLDWWSARGSLYVTSAEGFFLISGIVLGIIRGAKLINRPFIDVVKLLLKRGLKLYITSIILVITFTLFGWWFFMDNPGLKYDIISPTTGFLDMLWQTITLRYFYGWADYLRLYAIFLFATPLVLWLLRKGWWYIVMILSIGVWSLFPSDPSIPDKTQELLQPLSWQLIFFAGITIGFYWEKIYAWWRSLAPKTKTVIKIIVTSLALATVIINVYLVFGKKIVDAGTAIYLNDLQHKLYINYFDKERLPIARLLMFGLWFLASFFVFRRFESLIIKILGWLLLPFGTNSLYVYTVHAFLIFFIHLWVKSGNILFNFIFTTIIIAVIWLAVRYKFLMKIIPR
jgi:hypothetical protein